MSKGYSFLDKFMISMLCYLKKNLLDAQIGEMLYRLGASYIKTMGVDWGQVIDMTQVIYIN